VLARLADKVPRQITLRDIPVAQCIPQILAALGDSERIEFTSLFADLADRPLVIATFLALLELIRRGAVRVWQEVRQGPILLGRGDRFGVTPDESKPLDSYGSSADVGDQGEEPSA
jgi:chromatin segregation and condensation protein Rec8/ScpA/Scc1 (kleisin family)